MGITELQERKVAAAKQAQAIIDAAAAEHDRPFTDEEREKVKQHIAESMDWAKKLDAAIADNGFKSHVRTLLGETDGTASTSGDGSKKAEPRQWKSPGTRFVESQGYAEWLKRGRSQGLVATLQVDEGLGLKDAFFGRELKTTFTESAATLTQYDRQPGIVLVGLQRLTIADLLARGQTTMNTIRYVQEDTYTNAATTVAEGATKPEAAFDTSEQDAPVRKIAVTAKVTDELFSDFPAMRDYIDQRLPFMVQQTEEAQLLTGDGNAPNIKGILNVAGIQTQAKGADPAPDAIYKAMVKILAVGFFVPDGVVIHPTDWQGIRLLRTSTDAYMWGPPTDAGVERIWGEPVDITTAITQGTALVGSYRLGAQIFYRQGITIETTNSNEDDFKKNLIAIRAEERLALAVYRPKAFCTVTGL